MFKAMIRLFINVAALADNVGVLAETIREANALCRSCLGLDTKVACPDDPESPDGATEGGNEFPGPARRGRRTAGQV